MEEREIEALNIIWESSRRTVGTFRDMGLRIEKAEKAMRDLAKTYDTCKIGHKLIVEFQKAMRRGNDSAKKIESLSKDIAKLEKMGIDAAIKQFAKLDANIVAVDDVATKCLAWIRRSWEPIVIPALRGDQKPVPPEASMFMASIKTHLGNRNGANKGYNDFRKLARV